MTELLALTVSFVVGWLVTRRLRRRPPRREMMIALRQKSSQETAYRDTGSEIICTLDELRATLEAAGLVTELSDGEVRLHRGDEHIRVTVPDPRRVTLASLDMFQTGSETLEYDLALALVPVFGPITLVDTNFGVYAIDGSRDAAALAAERGERIKALAKAIGDDMAEKAAAYSLRDVPR